MKTREEALEYGLSFPDTYTEMPFHDPGWQLDVILVPYECAEGMKETKTLLEKIWPGQSVGIFIGPEGGFEEAEIEQAQAHIRSHWERGF